MTRTPLRAAVAVSRRKLALRQGLLWSAVLLSGAMGFSGLPARAQSFTPPANISGGTTAFSPQVIADSTGNLDIAYLDTGSDVSSNSLWFVRGTLSGGVFHPLAAPVQAAASAGNSFSMALESDCVIDFAFANGFGVESSDIFFAQSADCGKMFQSTNVTKNPAGSSVGNPQLAIQKGVAEIVWTAETPLNLTSTIFHAERQSSGTFTAPAPLGSGSAGVSCVKVFAVPGTSNTAVGWCDIDKGSIWIVNPVASGEQPLNIGTGQSAQFAADPAGDIYAVWDDASNSAVWFSRSSGSTGGPTGGFSAAKQLFPVTSGAQTTVPQMAIDSKGNIDLLVSVEQRVGPPDRSTDTIQFSLSRSSDGGNNFAAPVSVAKVSCPLCGSGVPAQIAVDSAGDADVTWEALGGWGAAGFWFSHSNAQGSSFSAPVAIPASPTAGVGITTDATNHVFLSWTAQGAMISEGSAPSDFSVSVTPASLSAMPGGSVTAQVTLTATSGFNQAVSLGCNNLPAGAECSFSSASATPTASGTIVAMTVTIPPTLPPGGFPFVITATTPFEVQGVNIEESVGIATGQVSPTAVTIPVGGTASFTVTMTSTNGLSGQFQLACSAPAGVTCNFTPASFFLPPNGRMSATLTAQVTNVPATGMALKSPLELFPAGPAAGSRIGLAATQNILAELGLLLLTALSAALANSGKRRGYAIAQMMAVVAMIFALAAAMVSCGGAVSKQTIGTNTTAIGSPNTPAGATSVTFPMTVVAQSGGSVVNVGTVTVTVP
jgi:hypothetical protein